jgi:hypothetical protein
MKYLLFFLLSVIVSLFAGCSDDSTGPNNTETVIFSQDSLVLYSSDSVLIKSAGIITSTPYNNNTKWSLSFNSITNDSSIFSKLIIKASTQSTQGSLIIHHIDETKTGNDININYNNISDVQRNDTYNFILNTTISFDTSYHINNKYIKLFNIQLKKIN